MEWYFSGGLLIGSLVGLMAFGIPVAIAFIIVDIIGALIFAGGFNGLIQIVENSTDLITTFTLAPVPLFVLMGALFFYTGLANKVFDALDHLLGNIPGRLSFLTVGGGTIFSTLTGNTLANAAMLGSLLVPEMQKRGYSKRMSLGPILGTGGLAMIIPPSGLAVLLASIANIDVGKVLVAGIFPGIILALLYCGLIYLQLKLDPSGAPIYQVEKSSGQEKLMAFLVNILPMSLIVFMVVGLIVLGIATPTESAAFGVVGVIMLAAAFRQLSIGALITSLQSTVRVAGMIFFILMGSTVFSQLLAFSGASSGMLNWAIGFDLAPWIILFLMFLLLLFLGMFMDQVSMMLITVPIFFPLAASLGYESIWFAIFVLLALEMSLTTPPFGLLLFIMLGVAPEGTKLSHVVYAAAPYLVCDAILVILLVYFPFLVMYLPNLMN